MFFFFDISIYIYTIICMMFVFFLEHAMGHGANTNRTIFNMANLHLGFIVLCSGSFGSKTQFPLNHMC